MGDALASCVAALCCVSACGWYPVVMARTKVRAHAQRRSAPVFPVEVRSLNKPNDGWTLEKALDLLGQGYQIPHVSHVSGFNAAFLEANSRHKDDEQIAG